MDVQIIALRPCFLIIWGVYTNVKLLDHMAILFLIFLEKYHTIFHNDQ